MLPLRNIYHHLRFVAKSESVNNLAPGPPGIMCAEEFPEDATLHGYFDRQLIGGNHSK